MFCKQMAFRLSAAEGKHVNAFQAKVVTQAEMNKQVAEADGEAKVESKI
jgi:hypothetical protein